MKLLPQWLSRLFRRQKIGESFQDGVSYLIESDVVIASAGLVNGTGLPRGIECEIVINGVPRGRTVRGRLPEPITLRAGDRITVNTVQA